MSVDSFKTEINAGDIEIFVSYRAVNTLLFSWKNQSVNFVWGNNWQMFVR